MLAYVFRNDSSAPTSSRSPWAPSPSRQRKASPPGPHAPGTASHDPIAGVRGSVTTWTPCGARRTYRLAVDKVDGARSTSTRRNAPARFICGHSSVHHEGVEVTTNDRCQPARHRHSGGLFAFLRCYVPHRRFLSGMQPDQFDRAAWNRHLKLQQRPVPTAARGRPLVRVAVAGLRTNCNFSAHFTITRSSKVPMKQAHLTLPESRLQCLRDQRAR